MWGGLIGFLDKEDYSPKGTVRPCVISCLSSETSMLELGALSFSETNTPCLLRDPAMTNATTEMSLSRMLREGPEVSLKGSPTVSPTTAALCGADPL